MFDKLVSSAARRAKTVAGWMIFRSGLGRRARRNRALIVVFHRVNDRYPHDPLTLSERRFDQFLRFFREYFVVVPLSRLLEMLETGADLSNVLVITFDDGYWGNAAIAAPILARHELPACFFVTTDFIGSRVVPWWDAEKGIESQWMSWDQVRSLRDAGHEIGSHTKTHADLGVVGRDDARREIGEGIARLRAELAEDSGLFAYPYGGRKNLSEENASLPAELGLRCNLSAHGGSVRPGDDPFRLKRVTISEWFLSPYQFGLELVAGYLERS